ncbi:MAG TPA: SDR family oxidoreductase [Gemmatimonas sp.]|nr:SDR family oxidoreductase [Gemmatimonas sp.]
MSEVMAHVGELTQYTSRFDVAERVVVITGGAGLLGSAYSRALGEAGARVVVADIDGATAADIAADIGGRSLAVQVDVTDPGSVAELVRSTVMTFGQVHALVNNAAIDPKFDATSRTAHSHGFESYPLVAWKRALDVNLTGPFLCAQAFLPHLLASGTGTIVNVASTYGLVAPDQRLYDDGISTAGIKPPAYSVTKSGIIGLTRYLAAYYGAQGLRVNALVPGGVFTDHDEGFVNRYSSRTPLGRMATRDEYSAALQFLISPASSYMTGSCLVVDGGWTAW